MRLKLPTEFGDAMLVAAGVMLLVLFTLIYLALPSSLEFETTARVVDYSNPGQ